MPRKPLWTSLQNFTESFALHLLECRGCHALIGKNESCLSQHIGMDKKTVIALHDKRCHELWEQGYWLAISRHRQQISGKIVTPISLGGIPIADEVTV